MEKDCGYWFYQQHPAWQSSNLNCASASLDEGPKVILPGFADNYIVSPNVAYTGLKMGQGNDEPHRWMYCLSNYHQALTPCSVSVTSQNFLASPYRCNWEATPNALSGLMQKSSFVLDQTGGQPNLNFSSAIGSPIENLISGSRKPTDACGLLDEELKALADNGNPINLSRPVVSEESTENDKHIEGSEMHEDTEELNALLYSDDDDIDSGNCEEDEETSTGHSPSAVGEFEKQEELDGSMEEVASSGGPTKRRRLLDGRNNESYLVDTASSVKLNRRKVCDDDAESSCAEGRAVGGEVSVLSGKKRFRIRETLNILQKIVPGGRSMDATLLLDEAIRYLGSMKVKFQTFGATSM